MEKKYEYFAKCICKHDERIVAFFKEFYKPENWTLDYVSKVWEEKGKPLVKELAAEFDTDDIIDIAVVIKEAIKDREAEIKEIHRCMRKARNDFLIQHEREIDKFCMGCKHYCDGDWENSNSTNPDFCAILSFEERFPDIVVEEGSSGIIYTCYACELFEPKNQKVGINTHK